MGKVVAIIQARMGSSRLPGKTLMDIQGKPAIWHLFNRLRFAQKVDEIVLATTTNELDDELCDFAARCEWKVFRGDEQDVLDRYYQAARQSDSQPSDIIVRLTGDDILADPKIVDLVVELLLAHQPLVKHASNDRMETFPYGAGVEAFTFDSLERAWQEAELPAYREHVTPYIRKNPAKFPFVEIRGSIDYSRYRFSIDYFEDLEFNREIFAKLYRKAEFPFSLSDIINCIERFNITNRRCK